VRAFVITASPGAIRGGHGHARGRQLLMLVSGEIDVEVRYRNCGARLRLDLVHRAVLIEPLVWSRQLYYGDNTAMVVFCDTPYDPTDYIWGDARREGATSFPPEPDLT
jgi:dTDP-4-dehydrorhamnose 3,5-epimerase-like enzyme